MQFSKKLKLLLAGYGVVIAVCLMFLGKLLELDTRLFLLWMSKQKKPALALMVGMLLDLILVGILKIGFGRPRPFEVLDVNALIGESFASFPSAHAQRSFLAATVLGSFYKKWRIVLYLFAFIISISRIMIGVHYPLDILFGAINGIMIGIYVLNIDVNSLLKKIEKKMHI